MNKIFQLNFLGVADSSSSTLNSLREVFITNFGLNEEQIETIFLSAPVTLIESNNREELLPIYEFLKSALAKVIIEEITEEEGEDDDEESAFDFSEEDDDDDLPVEKESETTGARILHSSNEEVSFDFDSGEEAIEPAEFKPTEVVNPIKNIPEDTVFSFDDQEDADLEEEEEPVILNQISNNANDDDISLSFESFDEEEPNLHSVNSAKLSSEAISRQEDSPLKSNALKLNFDIKPKDQVFLENLKRQREESKVEIKDEEIELKDGPIISPDSLASTGFDNIIHKSAHGKSDIYTPRKPLIPKETLQYLIPIIIGCSFVVVGSILILPQTEVPKPLATTIIAKTSVATSTTSESESTPVSSKYYGKSENQDVIVEGTLTRYDKELRNISLSITPPPPQALTPEDLVLNKKLPPWIEKLTLDQFKLNPAKDDDSFLGVTKARIFVNYDQHKYRLIVPVAVRAVLNKGWNTARVAVVMKVGIKDPPEVPFLIDISPNGQHKMYLKSVFEVVAVSDEVAADTATPADATENEVTAKK